MSIKKRSFVVFGGGGFLGTNLCRRLADGGNLVRAFGHRSLFSGALEGVDWRQGDFSDRAVVADAMQDMDVAFHLINSTVPYSANLDVVGDVRQNLMPSLAFLELAHNAGIKRVVFISSGGTIYGRPHQIPTEETAPTDPITAYGISKLAIEKYLALYKHLHGLDYKILRVANPFGPFQVSVKGQGIIAEIISRAISGERIEIWGDGSVVRDFIFVDDVIDALELAANDECKEPVFNIGSGVGRSVREILGVIETSLNSRLDIVWKKGREVDVPVSILSVRRAREKLGWIPRTQFEHGIIKTIAWWTANIDVIKQSMIEVASKKEVHSRVD